MLQCPISRTQVTIWNRGILSHETAPSFPYEKKPRLHHEANPEHNRWLRKRGLLNLDLPSFCVFSQWSWTRMLRMCTSTVVICTRQQGSIRTPKKTTHVVRNWPIRWDPLNPTPPPGLRFFSKKLQENSSIRTYSSRAFIWVVTSLGFICKKMISLQ